MNNLKWQSRSHTMIDKENTTKIITPLGEMEMSEWMREVEELAVENKEEDILAKVYEYCRKELAWLKMKEFNPSKEIEELEEDEARQVLREMERKKKKYKDELERDIKEIALQYYACRIWEITDWVDYELFKINYMEESKQLTI